MSCSNLTVHFLYSKASPLKIHIRPRTRRLGRSFVPQIRCNLRELQDRIGSVSNTKKISEAMKMVAAAKVRRGPLATIRPVKKAERRMAKLWELGLDYSVISVGWKGKLTVKRGVTIVQ